MTKTEQIQHVSKNPFNINDIKNPCEEACLKAVSKQFLKLAAL